MHTRTSLSSGCLKTGQRLTALIKLGERPSIMQWGLGASPSSCISLSGEFVFCMLPGWSSSPWREQYQTRHSVAVASLPLARTLVHARAHTYTFIKETYTHAHARYSGAHVTRDLEFLSLKNESTVENALDFPQVVQVLTLRTEVS